MFDKPIYETAFTISYADKFCQHIKYSGNRAGCSEDMTCLSTLRALLYKRLGENTAFQYLSIKNELTLSDILRYPVFDFIHSFLNNRISQNSLQFICFKKNVWENVFQMLWDNVGKDKAFFTDLVFDKDNTCFLSSHYGKNSFLVYKNEESNQSFVYTSQQDELHKNHIVQAIIPKLLPNIFKEQPLTEEELNLLKCLFEQDEQKYLDSLEQIAIPLNFREKYIENSMKGYDDKFIETAKSGCLAEIFEINRQIQEHKRLLQICYRQWNQKQIYLLGINARYKDFSPGKELSKCFIGNEDLILTNVDQERITFVVKGYADNYDPDAASTAIKNFDSAIYKKGFCTKEQMQSLYRAIFVEEKYKLRICAAYSINLKEHIVTGHKYYECYPAEISDYLRNPHIEHYGCMGGYEERIDECLQNLDLTEAMSYAIMSVRNLEFFDATVMEHLSHDIGVSGKCLESKDGRFLTAKEALAELNGREGNAECQKELE